MCSIDLENFRKTSLVGGFVVTCVSCRAWCTGQFYVDHGAAFTTPATASGGFWAARDRSAPGVASSGAVQLQVHVFLTCHSFLLPQHRIWNILSNWKMCDMTCTIRELNEEWMEWCLQVLASHTVAFVWGCWCRKLCSSLWDWSLHCQANAQLGSSSLESQEIHGAQILETLGSVRMRNFSGRFQTFGNFRVYHRRSSITPPLSHRCEGFWSAFKQRRTVVETVQPHAATNVPSLLIDLCQMYSNVSKWSLEIMHLFWKEAKEAELETDQEKTEKPNCLWERQTEKRETCWNIVEGLRSCPG